MAFTLFRPGFWLDQIDSPFLDRPGAEIHQVAEAQPADSQLRASIAGPDFNDPNARIQTTIIVPLGAAAGGETRLEKSGILVMVEDGQALLEEPFPGTPFESLGREFDFYADDPVTVAMVQVAKQRWPKEVFYIQALLVLVVIILLQRGRAAREVSS